METLAETWLRPKNEITIPRELRSYCNLKPGDGIRWIKQDNGDVLVKKIVSKIVNHNHCGGEKDGSFDKS